MAVNYPTNDRILPILDVKSNFNSLIRGAIMLIPGTFNVSVEELIKATKILLMNPKGGIGSVLEDNGDFGKAKTKYVNYLREEIGSVQILGINKATPLEEIYITTRFHRSEESYFKFSDYESKNLESGRYLSKRIQSDVELKSVLKESKGKGVTVLGDPGAGKSTLLRAIALSSILENGSISETNFGNEFPIYIELRKYSESDIKTVSIEEYFYSKHGDGIFNLVVQRLLESGRASILLDAFDEVPSDSQFEIAERILELRHRYFTCPLIVSSRIGNPNTIPSLAIFEVSEFDQEERERYIIKWLTIQGRKDEATKLIREINHQKEIDEITTNPLLLSLVCVLFLRDLEIPSRKNAIYRRCVEILIREWDSERLFRRKSDFEKIDDETKIRILSEVANYFMVNNARYLHEDIIGQEVGKILEKYEIRSTESKDFLREIFSHHGLIVKAGHEFFGFSHLTFQEYLAAKYYVINNKIRELINQLNRNIGWLDTFIMAMSEVANALDAIQVIGQDRKITKDQKLKYISLILTSSKAIVDPLDRVKTFSLFSEMAANALSDHDIEKINLVKTSSNIIRMARDAGAVSKPDLLNTGTEVFKVTSRFFEDILFDIIASRSRYWLSGDISSQKIKDGDVRQLLQFLTSEKRFYICVFSSYESYILITEIDGDSDLVDIVEYSGDLSLFTEEIDIYDVDIDWQNR